MFDSLKTEGFLEKFRKWIFPLKMVQSKNYWNHQEVLLKTFPMNGHVSMFRQS
jgi:hypothetical protein